MNNSSYFGSRTISLVLIVLLGFSGFASSVSAYGVSSYRYQQKAATFVDNYIARLQYGGYSTSEMTRMLIDLRSIYIKKQKSHLYSGLQLQEIEAIIEELDSAIAGVSEGTCDTCNIYDTFDVYVPPRSSYDYYRYNNTYNYNSIPSRSYSPYYQVNQRQPIRISDAILTSNGSYYTEIRTDLVRENTSKEYDVYTFVPQLNGYSSNQFSSNQFISTSLFRQFNTAQGRMITVSFGAEYDSNRVRNIRSSAQSVYKTSQTTLSSYGNFSDIYRSFSPDEFTRQAVWNGSTRVYRTYKLYVARDDSQAFIVDYVESGAGNSSYSQNISSIDTSSFADNGYSFSHTYRTVNGYSKRYKQYIYTPSAGANVSTIFSNLGISNRTTYQMGTNRTQYVNGTYTNTALNGYTVNSGYVSAMESTFASYGYSSSYVTLPGSNSQITFVPRTGYDFQNARLSDNTYRMYRLLVAEDGSEAYLTEYVQNQPNY